VGGLQVLMDKSGKDCELYTTNLSKNVSDCGKSSLCGPTFAPEGKLYALYALSRRKLLSDSFTQQFLTCFQFNIGLKTNF